MPVETLNTGLRKSKNRIRVQAADLLDDLDWDGATGLLERAR